MRIKRESVIDTVTGEVLYTKTRQLRLFLFADRGFMFNNNHRSVKMYPTGEWPKLTHSEVGQLIAVGKHMQEGNKIPLSTAEMAGILEQSVNRTYIFIRSMIDAGVMKRQGHSLYINPLILFVGKYMSRELYQLFQDQLDEVLPAWVKIKFQEELTHD